MIVGAGTFQRAKTSPMIVMPSNTNRLVETNPGNCGNHSTNTMAGSSSNTQHNACRRSTRNLYSRVATAFKLRSSTVPFMGSSLQRITLTCGRGARVSIEESLLPRASAVHDNK